MPSKLISAHTFAYISLDAMIPQEADQTHIEYGFPVNKSLASARDLHVIHNIGIKKRKKKSLRENAMIYPASRSA